MTTPAPGRAARGIPRITPRPGLAWPGAWVQRALCAQADPEAWFPDDETSELAAAAVRVCARCPVRGDCLAHALAIGERHGIWGGLTAAQRLGLLAEQETAA